MKIKCSLNVHNNIRWVTCKPFENKIKNLDRLTWSDDVLSPVKGMKKKLLLGEYVKRGETPRIKFHKLRMDFLGLQVCSLLFIGLKYFLSDSTGISFF